MRALQKVVQLKLTIADISSNQGRLCIGSVKTNFKRKGANRTVRGSAGSISIYRCVKSMIYPALPRSVLFHNS